MSSGTPRPQHVDYADHAEVAASGQLCEAAQHGGLAGVQVFRDCAPGQPAVELECSDDALVELTALVAHLHTSHSSCRKIACQDRSCKKPSREVLGASSRRQPGHTSTVAGCWPAAPGLRASVEQFLVATRGRADAAAGGPLRARDEIADVALILCPIDALDAWKTTSQNDVNGRKWFRYCSRATTVSAPWTGSSIAYFFDK
jgi:hypothetical protein